MNRKQNLLVWIPILLVAVATVGCPKKKPTPPPIEEPMEDISTPTAPEEVPPTAPNLGMDETTIYDGELEAVNTAVRENGELGDVYFDFDRYELTSASRDRLAKNAQFMKEHPEFVFSIQGHCDERGTNEYNLALGDRRANGAKGYVESLSINGSRMQTVSYGEEKPRCTEASESCWGRNRRAEFWIVGRTN